MKSPIYVVTMYRWGDRECHSYVLGAYSTKTKAEKAGEKEKEYRGGNKYYPEILEVPVDVEFKNARNFKAVNKLGKNPDFCRG